LVLSIVENFQSILACEKNYESANTFLHNLNINGTDDKVLVDLTVTASMYKEHLPIWDVFLTKVEDELNSRGINPKKVLGARLYL